ncbi:hypothetical protein RFI_18313, partial [Reticulomyxa filosa]
KKKKKKKKKKGRSERKVEYTFVCMHLHTKRKFGVGREYTYTHTYTYIYLVQDLIHEDVNKTQSGVPDESAALRLNDGNAVNKEVGLDANVNVSNSTDDNELRPLSRRKSTGFDQVMMPQTGLSPLNKQLTQHKSHLLTALVLNGVLCILTLTLYTIWVTIALSLKYDLHTSDTFASNFVSICWLLSILSYGLLEFFFYNRYLMWNYATYLIFVFYFIGVFNRVPDSQTSVQVVGILTGVVALLFVILKIIQTVLFWKFIRKTNINLT